MKQPFSFFKRSTAPEPLNEVVRPGVHNPPEGPMIREMTKAILPSLQAQNRELQRILADSARRKRAEDRRVADLIGQNFEE
jgi:hypothetical protein